MSKPTHQDGMLLLQLKDWIKNMGFYEATMFLGNENFPLELSEYTKKIDGKPEEIHVFTFIEVMETIGALFKHGLLHPALLFDVDTFQGYWERYKDLIVGVRERDENPKLLECFEALVEAEKQYYSE